jgi:TPP-dependent pyruvate/acetoin dehydrogenase alpha subunit
MITSHTRESLKAFEEKIRLAWEAGELPSLIHLCGGNEDQLLEIFQHIRPQDWIFTSHRAHYHCLLKGMPEDELEAFIRSDRSMFAYSRELRIYQSAILGGCCGIATGVAKAIQQNGEDAHVYCFIGDGAVDNGHLYEALNYATGHRLPVTFVIEDNDRQVDTSIESRRGPHWLDFVMESPNLIRYQYESRWPHGGSGCAHQITFQRQHPLT